MDHVEDKMSGAPKNNCRQNVLDFWKDYNDLTTYPVPDGAKRKPSYITAMAQQLGSMYTQDRMALVQMRINKLKFNVGDLSSLPTFLAK